MLRTAAKYSLGAVKEIMEMYRDGCMHSPHS